MLALSVLHRASVDVIIQPIRGYVRVRSELHVILKPNSEGRAGSPVGRRGVDNICPPWPRWGGHGRKQSSGYPDHHRVAPAGGRTGWVPHPAEKKLRAHRTGGLLHVCSGGPNTSPRLVTPLGRKRDTWRASNRRRRGGHIDRAGFVWCSYFASQGIAALVRPSAHRIPTRDDTLWGLRGHIVWSGLARAGVRALGAKEHDE